MVLELGCTIDDGAAAAPLCGQPQGFLHASTVSASRDLQSVAVIPHGTGTGPVNDRARLGDVVDHRRMSRVESVIW